MLLMLLTSLCRNLLAWVFNTCNNNLALFAVWTGAYDRGHFRWGSDMNGKWWCLIEYQDIFYVINYSHLVIKTIGQDLSTRQTVEHVQINCPGVCLWCQWHIYTHHLPSPVLTHFQTPCLPMHALQSHNNPQQLKNTSKAHSATSLSVMWQPNDEHWIKIHHSFL